MKLQKLSQQAFETKRKSQNPTAKIISTAVDYPVFFNRQLRNAPIILPPVRGGPVFDEPAASPCNSHLIPTQRSPKLRAWRKRRTKIGWW